MARDLLRGDRLTVSPPGTGPQGLPDLGTAGLLRPSQRPSQRLSDTP